MELLFLHALPLDGTMWAGQRNFFANVSHTPTLYSFGDKIEDWARGALAQSKSNRLIVVGCSVGGSCALEIAKIAPERIAALVLIGTKADHRPEPAFLADALETIETEGIEAAWTKYWVPLFSRRASPDAIDQAKSLALHQSADNIKRGVHVFHTRPSRGDVIASFPGPIHFVTGVDDTAPGYQRNLQQTALARNGRLHVIENCGHYVSIEQADRFNAILQSVISDCD